MVLSIFVNKEGLPLGPTEQPFLRMLEPPNLLITRKTVGKHVPYINRFTFGVRLVSNVLYSVGNV